MAGRRKAKRTAVERADIEVTHSARDARHTPLVKALGWLSEAADQPPLFALAGLTLGLGLGRRDMRLARAGAGMLAAEWLATAMKSAIKHRVSRTRPRKALDGGGYEMKAGGPDSSEWNSFPSGHTAGAVAVTRALAREYPRTAVPGALAAAAVAAIQIPRCAHYPSDLAAGAAIGLVAEAIVDQSVRIIAQRLSGDGSDASRAASPGDISPGISVRKPSRA